MFTFITVPHHLSCMFGECNKDVRSNGEGYCCLGLQDNGVYVPGTCGDGDFRPLKNRMGQCTTGWDYVSFHAEGICVVWTF